MNDLEIIEFFKDKRGKINPNKTKLTYLDKYSEIKEYLENRYEQFFDYTTTLQFIFNGDQTLPRCEHCNKILDKPNKRWCNTKCQLTDPNYIDYRVKAIDYDKRKIKFEETCLKRYGATNYFKSDQCIRNSHTPEARNKAVKSTIQTCLERYGVTNPLQIPEVKEKCLKTKLKHRPNDPNNTEKIKQTMLDRYGVTGTMASPELRQKVMNTKLKRYNDATYTNPDKMKKTLLERYGGNPTIFGSKKFKESMLKKYGVEHYCQTLEFAKKRKHKYYYDNLSFDSLPEIAFYIYQRDLGKTILRECIRFPYIYKKKTRYYIPDFKVNRRYYEIKGEQFFKNDKMINPFNRKNDKIYEAKHQCMIKNKVIIVRDFTKYFNYVAKNYGKNFLEKFKNQKSI